ncbi:MAG: tetratricopeptide repeat protein [Bacteroidales bacterium]|jgi:tetratricopeptide (TPR) repeat protein|nr:tetratricopeptide repeat protein [Bacteroidales bacterium]
MKLFVGKLYIIIIFVVVVFGTGCSSTKSVQSNINISVYERDSLTDDEIFEFRYQFFEANKLVLAGNYDLALNLFISCLKIDPYSAATHYKLASIYLQNKEINLALEHAEKAAIYNPKNQWYLYLAGNLNLKNNNFDKAKETFIKLIEIDDSEIDFYLNLADVYLKNKEFNGALKIYNEIEDKFGISEIISLQKNKLYLALYKKKEALNELILLSKSNINNVKYKRYIAEFYLQLQDYDNAIITYNSILSEFPEYGYSHIGLAESYRSKGDLKNSFKELKLAFESEDVASDIKFNMLLSIIKNTGDNVEIQTAVYDLTTILVKKYPNDADIATIYANLLLQKGLLKEAREELIKVIVLRKDKFAVWEQLVLLDNEFLDWNSMFEHTKEALNYFPNQSVLYFFNGFSAFQLEKYDISIKNLSFGYKLITKEDPLLIDYLTFLGESYYKKGDKEKAYNYFQDVIEKEPENIMVLNNYAYYLSEDNMELDKAEKMSKTTIIVEPANPTYLDTDAWILFKMERNDEALIYIEKAIDNDEDNSDVVLEHYGDILYHNGKIEDAIIQWIKAREKGVGSGLLYKKIEERSYFK